MKLANVLRLESLPFFLYGLFQGDPLVPLSTYELGLRALNLPPFISHDLDRHIETQSIWKHGPVDSDTDSLYTLNQPPNPPTPLRVLVLNGDVMMSTRFSPPRPPPRHRPYWLRPCWHQTSRHIHIDCQRPAFSPNSNLGS